MFSFSNIFIVWYNAGMLRTIGYYLILILVVIAGYYAWRWYRSERIFEVRNLDLSEQGEKLREEGDQLARKSLNSVGSFFKSLPAEAVNQVKNLIEDSKKRIAEKTTEFLTGSSTVPQMIFPSPGSGNLDVCLTQLKSRELSYSIESPFGERAFGYEVDWQDGEVSRGEAGTSTRRVAVRHTYLSAGIFTTKFKVWSGGDQAAADQRICVE